MLRFALATLGPAGLLALAALWGGAWPVLALLAMTALTAGIDRLSVGIPAPLPGLPAARALSVTLGLLHFPLLCLSVLNLSGALQATVPERIFCFLAFGVFFGQISNSNAHELIHAGPRPLRRLGEAIYASLLFAHHASAHRLVHHVHVATPEDPNSARAGESFYRFAPRAWIGSFRAGLAAESQLRRRAGARASGLHPYWRHAALTLLALAGAWALAGSAGLAALVGLSAYAQMQLLLSDYVQHYGLRRAMGPQGRAEPAGARHSWNAPHVGSGAMMLNAPRHSDHHLRPARPYESLELDPEHMPVLPHALPVMAVIALIPPLWRRVMRRPLAHWQTLPGAAGGPLRSTGHTGDPAFRGPERHPM